MMKVLIIEDEPQAARRLEGMLKALRPDANLLATLDTIQGTVAWLKNNPAPDLILMDVQLADGISFQIFESVTVQSPVIFTTAYDAYALKAFKVNSIDYLLKPYDESELKQALDKFEQRSRSASGQDWLSQMEKTLQQLTRRYKERFVIRVGERLITVETDEILYFFSQDKATFAQTMGRRAILDFTLDDLEGMMDPEKFFRINRKYIIALRGIEEVSSYPNSRLLIRLKGGQETPDAIVSRERVDLFRQWLDR